MDFTSKFNTLLLILIVIFMGFVKKLLASLAFTGVALAADASCLKPKADFHYVKKGDALERIVRMNYDTAALDVVNHVARANARAYPKIMDDTMSVVDGKLSSSPDGLLGDHIEPEWNLSLPSIGDCSVKPSAAAEVKKTPTITPEAPQASPTAAPTAKAVAATTPSPAHTQTPSPTQSPTSAPVSTSTQIGYSTTSSQGETSVDDGSALFYLFGLTAVAMLAGIGYGIHRRTKTVRQSREDPLPSEPGSELGPYKELYGLPEGSMTEEQRNLLFQMVGNKDDARRYFNRWFFSIKMPAVPGAQRDEAAKKAFADYKKAVIVGGNHVGDITRHGRLHPVGERPPVSLTRVLEKKGHTTYGGDHEDKILQDARAEGEETLGLSRDDSDRFRRDAGIEDDDPDDTPPAGGGTSRRFGSTNAGGKPGEDGTPGGEAAYFDIDSDYLHDLVDVEAKNGFDELGGDTRLLEYVGSQRTRKGRHIFDSNHARQLGVYDQISERAAGFYKTMSAKHARQRFSDDLGLDISEALIYRMARERLGDNEYQRIANKRLETTHNLSTLAKAA